MRVTFLVPARNAAATIAGTLRSILAQNPPAPWQIVVVDDGSQDGTAEAAEALAPRIPALEVRRRAWGGEAAALNRGLELARGELVALVEADVELQDGWLELLLAELDDPSVWGAGGLLLPAPHDRWIARLAGYEVTERMEGQQRHPVHITSAAALYRRSAFAAVGGFNENLLNASLDSDFNRRLRAAGGRLAFEPRALAVHHYKQTLGAYLVRNWSYGRFRAYVPEPNLYPGDTLVRLQALAALGLLPALAAAPWSVAPLVGVALLNLALALPPALRFLRRYGDRAALAYPLVAPLRSLVGGLGYLAGVGARLARG